MIQNDYQLKVTRNAIDNFRQALQQTEDSFDGVHPDFLKIQRDAIKSMVETLLEEVREYESRPIYGDGKVISKEVKEYADKYIAENGGEGLRDMLARGTHVRAMRSAIYAAAERFKTGPGPVASSLIDYEFRLTVEREMTRLSGENLDMNRRLAEVTERLSKISQIDDSVAAILSKQVKELDRRLKNLESDD